MKITNGSFKCVSNNEVTFCKEHRCNLYTKACINSHIFIRMPNLNVGFLL